MLYYFALLSLLMSFLLAIYNWKVQKNALYIAGILLIISTYALTHFYTDSSQSDFSLALLYGTLSPFWLLPGPLLYFYFRSILNPAKQNLTWRDGIHFVPSIIHLVNIFPYLISPFSYKLEVAHAIHQNLNTIQLININYLYSFKFAFLSRPIALLIYLLWCTLLFLRQISQVNRKTSIWLMCFIFTLLFTTTAYLSIAFTLFKSTFSVESVNTNPLYLSSGVAYIFLPIALILFFPEVLYGIKNTDGVEKKPQTELNEEELSFYTDLAKSIENYLHSEKPYLNPNFDLKDIANALGTTQKEISFACKHQLNKKFTDLRTHLRISHAKELLDKGLSENITIDAIGSNSGFKSRSTFYEAFKAETGMTPSQYLEKLA